jgi:hypothetical protein
MSRLNLRLSLVNDESVTIPTKLSEGFQSLVGRRIVIICVFACPFGTGFIVFNGIVRN